MSARKPDTITASLSPINRESELRSDATKLAELWKSAQIIHLVDARLSAADDSLTFIDASAVKALQETFIEGDRNWHANHTHCARCGAKTVSDLGGSVRVCVEDATQHHPRTDPAVIVLVRDKDDRILLGHQPIWPDKRFSTFAGFVETGESFEECVSREVFEEAGVYASEIKYLTSQPWPFPASIMIAFEAITHRPEEARPDGTEITEVRWFSRDEMKAAVASQDILLPPTISVARRMIEAWYTRIDGYTRDQLRGGESWRP
ncbi:MAG: NAD(+) diphosphatase [Actinobacteria bacterium]|nr:NAD(+) diphosphatase [Actinomycetota bacterium]